MLSVVRARSSLLRTTSRLCRFNSTSSTSTVTTTASTSQTLPPTDLASSSSASKPVPATSTSTPAFSITPGTAAEGAKRPHLNIPVNPNHGLYAFFRKKETADGQVKYETVEGEEVMLTTGRAWETAELRRKSFRDLHTLWYVLLRERNLIATQKHELARLGVSKFIGLEILSPLDAMCRKSMRRIKGVLQERRLAYEDAVDLIKNHKQNLQVEAQQADAEEKQKEADAERKRVQKRKAAQETMRRARAKKQKARASLKGILS